MLRHSSFVISNPKTRPATMESSILYQPLACDSGSQLVKKFLSFTVTAIIAGSLLTGSGCRRQTAEATGTSQSTAVDRVTAGKPVRKTLKLVTTQPGRIEAFEE